MAAHPQTEALRSPGLPRRAFARLGEVRPIRAAVALVGTAAIVVMALVALRLVTAAPANPKLLVPSGRHGMPGWMAGPLHGWNSGRIGFPELNLLLILMAALYVLVVLCSRWIPAWIAIAGAALLVALFTLAPPMFSTDIFNYVAYARMGALYHVNPYLHGAIAIAGDPSVRLTAPRR